MPTNSTGNEKDLKTSEKPVQKKATSKNKEKHHTKSQGSKLIYIGPNIPGGLSRFRVFRDGLPSFLKTTFKKHPELENLIVPIESFQEALKRVNTKGTIEHSAVKNLLKKRGEK